MDKRNEKLSADIPSTSEKCSQVKEATSESQKKPVLNYEILEEIFVRNIRSKESTEKFMLSGRQQLQIGLNYFKRIDKIHLSPSSMYIVSKNAEIFLNYKISFKPVLKAMGTSIKSIYIPPQTNEESIKDILEFFIHEGIQKVFICSKLPEKHFSTLCNITTITNFYYSSLNFSELTMIKSKSEEFGFETTFKELTQTKSEKKFALPWVKKLILRLQIEASDFTKESMKTVANIISETFPNFELIQLKFTFINASWKPLHSIMKEIDAEWFNGFTKNIKGHINLSAQFEEIDTDEQFQELIDGDEEYIDDYTAVKEFEISKDLCFQFYVHF